MTQRPGPHELPFVVEAPVAGTRTEHPGFDVYRPADADGPRPAVIFVPGPMPAEFPARPRQWPMFQGYAQLLAARGAVAVVLDLPYYSPLQAVEVAADLPAVVETVRGLDEVDADRIALWAFSGGGLLVGGWLADSPDWLRCLALTYPFLGSLELDPATVPPMPMDVVRPGRPLVLTRVGKEMPLLADAVERFLTTARDTGTEVQLIDVPEGQHAFDLLDHTEESRNAVLKAADLVAGHLKG